MKVKISSAKQKVVFIIITVLMTVSVFSGCKDSVNSLASAVAVAGVYPVTVAGVEIHSQPQKILVLSPSITDVVIELEYEKQLVAVSTDCTQSEYEIQVLPKVDPSDISAIQETAPDLIILEAGDDAERMDLSEITVPVIEIDLANSREDYERLYAQIATIFKGDGAGYDAGVAAAKKVFATLDDISRLTDDSVVTTGCYIYDIGMEKAVTGEMFGSVIMSYAGVTNIFNTQRSGEYEFSTLQISDPNVIFCAPGVKDQIYLDERFAGLQAVVKNRVYEIEENGLYWQGRTVVHTALQMAEYAFPELSEEASEAPTDPTSKIEAEVEDELGLDESEVSEQGTVALRNGDSGDAVLRLQERLHELGYITEDYDGNYLSYTEDAVTQFQQNNDLVKTGIADEATQERLFSDEAVAAE
jgi:ABC-type Fe3+-hydroxamate transport system, periplasmic component